MTTADQPISPIAAQAAHAAGSPARTAPASSASPHGTPNGVDAAGADASARRQPMPAHGGLLL